MRKSISIILCFVFMFSVVITVDTKAENTTVVNYYNRPENDLVSFSMDINTWLEKYELFRHDLEEQLNENYSSLSIKNWDSVDTKDNGTTVYSYYIDYSKDLNITCDSASGNIKKINVSYCTKSLDEPDIKTALSVYYIASIAIGGPEPDFNQVVFWDYNEYEDSGIVLGFMAGFDGETFNLDFNLYCADGQSTLKKAILFRDMQWGNAASVLAEELDVKWDRDRRSQVVPVDNILHNQRSKTEKSRMVCYTAVSNRSVSVAGYSAKVQIVTSQSSNGISGVSNMDDSIVISATYSISVEENGKVKDDTDNLLRKLQDIYGEPDYSELNNNNWYYEWQGGNDTYLSLNGVYRTPGLLEFDYHGNVYITYAWGKGVDYARSYSDFLVQQDEEQKLREEQQKEDERQNSYDGL